jgi:hypothetical protein
MVSDKLADRFKIQFQNPDFNNHSSTDIPILLVIIQTESQLFNSLFFKGGGDCITSTTRYYWYNCLETLTHDVVNL